MNRTHFASLSSLPTTPKRGADACGWRAGYPCVDQRNGAIPID